MMTITLIGLAVIIVLLNRVGAVNNPLIVFLIAAALVIGLAFIFKDRLNCPFAKSCPFSFCPLNKTD
jgi:hypothetical protein